MKHEIPNWMAAEVLEYDLDINPPPLTVLDIGANIGAFSMHYSAKWPEAKIKAFEPVKANVIGLYDNCRPNPNIEIFNAAVRNFTGHAHIYLGDQGVVCSFHQLGRQTAKTEPVVCMDAKKLPSCELVKIDTEGCEVEIIERLDLSKTRALVVEYHRPEDRTRIVALCQTLGLNLMDARPGSADHGVLKFGRDNGVTLPKQRTPNSELRAPRKIYVAIAAHFSHHDLIFVQGMMALVLRPPVAMQFGWSTDPSVERARNVLTANFLASDCTHILFIDADIGFSPADAARITSHDAPVVGGIYPLKNVNPHVEWCGNGVKNPQAEIDQQGGLQRVGCIGTGFMCIARAVFEKMAVWLGDDEKYIQDWRPNREEIAFWYQGVREWNGKRRFLTEDWMFCWNCEQLGIPVYADTLCVLRHAGRAEWPLPLQTGNPFAEVKSDK